MSTQERIEALGHPNIQATHPTTLMITKDTYLNQTGDCIVAVAADKSAADFNPQFKKALKKPNAKLTIQITAGNITENLAAYGSPNLILTHPTDIVVRKSTYISDRTLAIQADKASKDLQRALIEELKNPYQKISITLTIKC